MKSELHFNILYDYIFVTCGNIAQTYFEKLNSENNNYGYNIMASITPPLSTNHWNEKVVSNLKAYNITIIITEINK